MNSNLSKTVARWKSVFFGLIAVFLMFVGVLTTMPVQVSAEESGSGAPSPWEDTPRWFSCLWGEDSLPDLAYRSASTDFLPYNLFSKSAISSHVSGVDVLFNWMIDASAGAGVTETSFKTINEEILGVPLIEPTNTEDEATAGELEFNGGPKVSPYDRFGLAGLNWTGYKGEAHTELIDTCKGMAVTGVMNGEFYEGRKTPLSTWEFAADSNDPRSAIMPEFVVASGASFSLVIANAIFGITKLIVAITITLINLSFTNLVELFGIDQILTGSDGSSGLIGSLFANVFSTFIIVASAITGMYVLWVGIVKRGYREAVGVTIRTVALYMIAVIIFTAGAGWFVALPNNIAVVAQSVVISALGNGIAGGEGLCDSDISSKVTSITDGEKGSLDSSVDEAQDILKKASVNMRSAIGCQLWYSFAFRPWVEGQWGAGYDHLWAETEDENAVTFGKVTSKLGNQNSDWVGDAAVPLGDGTFIHNWAIFNLSTNTNAHAPLGLEGERSAYTTNVANDWWRIVDAISNYETEEIKSESVTGGVAGGPSAEVAASDIETLEYWEHWTGHGSAWSRVWVSIESMGVAIIGSIGPLFFAFLSAVLSIEIALLMAFSPLMFLLGCWAGKGWEIFKGWGELVINTTLQRIVVGILMSISIVLTMASIRVLEAGGAGNWFKGVVLMILGAVLLIKSRKRIVDMMASIRFASVDLSATRDKTKEAVGRVGKSGAGLAKGAASGAYGANAAKKDGVTGGGKSGSFKRGVNGAWAGMKREMKNQAYASNNKLVNSARTQSQVSSVNKKGIAGFLGGETVVFCQMCRRVFDLDDLAKGDPNVTLVQDENGNFYCTNCYDEGDVSGNVIEVDFSVIANSNRGSAKESKAKNYAPNLDRYEEGFAKAQTEKDREILLKGAATNIGTKLYEMKEAVDKDGSLEVEIVIPKSLIPYLNGSAVQNAVAALTTSKTDAEASSNLDKLAQAFAEALTLSAGEYSDSPVNTQELKDRIEDKYQEASVQGNSKKTP